MLAIFALFCCLAPIAPQVDAQPPLDVTGRYGVYEETLAGLVSPRAAAFDSEGNLYVASEHRVDVFDQDLAPTRTWGRRGDSPAHFRRPGGLAVAPNGVVYVSDTGNHRIQMFQRDGTWAGRFGSRGSGDEQLLQPAGLAVSEEHVFVADWGNNRIQVFDRLGRPVARWLADGLMRPSGIARDAEGHLFIADTGNQRIVVLDASGDLLLAFGERGPFPGLFAEPRGVVVDAGRLYVADTENHRIQVFDVAALLRGEAEPLYEWGKHALRPREGEGRLHYPDAIAVAPDGQQIVVCESFVDRAQIFGPATEPAATYAADPTVRTGIAAHYGPSISVLGPLLLLMEPESQTIQTMNVQGMSPIMVTRFGGWGADPGYYRRLEGVAFGPTGRVFSSDGDTARVQTWRLHYDHEEEAVFRPGASHLVRSVDLSILLGPGGSLASSLAKRWGVSSHVRPGQLAADEKGLIYVIDQVSASVLVFNAEWELQRAIGRGRLQHPLDIALLPIFGGKPSPSDDPDRKKDGQRIAVADGDLGQVLVFGPHGELDAILGAGVLVEPAAVAADSNGRVLVTDRGSHRVHVFDVTGTELATWGGEGLAAGKFFKPRGIAMLPSGHVLVLDHGNHRGQVFSENGTFQSAFGRRLYVEAAEMDAAILEEEAPQEGGEP
jgi:tripartite motif-containing protein 71